MNNRHVDSLLYDYATKRLENEEREVVESHLKTCEVCHAKLETMQATLPLLDHWTPESLPEGFADRVLEKLSVQKASLWQRMLDKLSFPFRYKLALQGLAVAIVICIAIIAYKGGFEPTGDRTPKEVVIDTGFVPAQNPIKIGTKNIDSTLDRLVELLKENDGSLVRRRPVPLGVEITLRFEPNKEEAFLRRLRDLGRLEMKKEGYKDGDGNIVIVLRKA